MSNYQVLHIEKRSMISSGLNRHITRQQYVTENGITRLETWLPDNADPNKSGENLELITRERINDKGQKYLLTLQQIIDERLRTVGIKPRKGQNTCLEIIFSGSPERMNSMPRQELICWANDTVNWAKDQWGNNNVVYAVLHMEEKTPHIHMIVVPLVNGESRRTKAWKKEQENKSRLANKYNIDHSKLRLCAGEVYTAKRLYEYHDSYAKVVGKKFGLERGVLALPGSKKSHMSSIEYNRQLESETREKRQLITELTSDYNEKVEELNKVKKSKSREELKKNAADVGARLLNVVGRGAVAEANKERDEALKRAEEAGLLAEKAMRRAKTAEEARSIAEAAESKARREKEEYSRRAARRAFEQGRMEAGKEFEELKGQNALLNAQLLDAREQNKALNKHISLMYCLIPRLKNWGHNYRLMKEAGISEADIHTIFRVGEKKNVKIPITYHGAEHIFTAKVDIAESTKGEMLVWLNDKSLSAFVNGCHRQLQEKEEGQSYGMNM